MSGERVIVDCTVTILNDHEADYWDTFGGSLNEVPEPIATDPLAQRTIEWLNTWVTNHEETCSGRDLQLLGTHLYRLLFTGKLKTSFERAYQRFRAERNRTREGRLRLRLVFEHDAKELVRYPWEFLYLEREPKGTFLAGEATELVLTRFVPRTADDIDNADQPRAAPLRILVAACHPPDLPQIDVTGVDEIMRDLKGSERKGTIEILVIDNPTYEELRARINDVQPHILHWIAHGEAGHVAMQKPPAEIEAESLDNEARRARGDPERPTSQHVEVAAQAIAHLFDGHRPRLAFLHACSGAEESLEGLYSTARELAYSQIPAVVAMQYRISNMDAITFARTFYGLIAQGEEVDVAVSQGRRALGEAQVSASGNSWNNRSFGTPVVYLRNAGSIIEGRVEAEPQAETESEGKVDCPYPNCRGLVRRTAKYCLTCSRGLRKCPSGHICGTDQERCDTCEYRFDASRTPTERSAAIGASALRSGMDPPR
jgi:hypothetical protein